MVETANMTSSDQQLLWDALYIALWDPPDGPRRSKSCLEEPHISVYAHRWGSQDTDVGLKSLAPDGTITGMIWSRLIPNKMGAWWDDETPQIGLAVFPGFQGHGIGKHLMRAYLDVADRRFSGVSLGVHPRNEIAINLYRKFAFETFATTPSGYLHMHHRLCPEVS